MQMMGQMVGQHQQRFDQRKEQRGDGDDRQRLPHLSEPRGYEEQGKERHDCRQHREDQWHPDASRPPDRSDDPRRAALSFLVDVLGHDDRIVHDDADGEYESEKRHLMERDVEQHHGGQGADRGHAEADGDPESQPKLEKQTQRDQDQQQPQGSVLEKKEGAFREDRRVVVPDADAHASRERGNDLVRDVVPNGARHVHHPLTVGLRNLDEHGGAALVPHEQTRVLEAVADLGNVTQAHHGAVLAAEDDDVLEILLVVALAEGPDPHLGPLGIDAARGQVKGTAADRVGDVGQGEPKGPQPLERHFDRDLVVAHPAGLDQGHVRERCEIVLEAVGEFLQRALGNVAVEH